MKSPITKVFENFSGEYLRLNSATIEQHKVIDSIKVCKTERLGFNVQACEDCGSIIKHYNSCSNRHCPNCQAINKDKWILAKQNDLLPVLFKCAWETIDSFSNDKRNRIEAKMGMIAILHTWKQDLDYHPHLHCIIPSGGITVNNKWKSSPTKGDYLFNTEALALTFKGKFLWHLKKYFKDGELQFWNLQGYTQRQYFYHLKETLYAKDWVTYSKMSFRDEQSVFEYLGRYTHKIAISNARIKSVTDKEVSFVYTDRADGYKKKIRTLAGADFIKLFLQHVLPARFMKIRNYGFLSSRNKTNMLEKLHQHFELTEYQKPKRMLVADILELVYGVKVGVCKHCGGKMHLIESKARPRASPRAA